MRSRDVVLVAMLGASVLGCAGGVVLDGEEPAEESALAAEDFCDPSIDTTPMAPASTPVVTSTQPATEIAVFDAMRDGDLAKLPGATLGFETHFTHPAIPGSGRVAMLAPGRSYRLALGDVPLSVAGELEMAFATFDEGGLSGRFRFRLGMVDPQGRVYTMEYMTVDPSANQAKSNFREGSPVPCVSTPRSKCIYLGAMGQPWVGGRFSASGLMLEKDILRDAWAFPDTLGVPATARLAYLEIELTDGGKLALGAVTLRSLLSFPTYHPLGFSIQYPLGPRAAIFINQIDDLTQQANACMDRHGWTRARSVAELTYLQFRTEFLEIRNGAPLQGSFRTNTSTGYARGQYHPTTKFITTPYNGGFVWEHELMHHYGYAHGSNALECCGNHKAAYCQ